MASIDSITNQPPHPSALKKDRGGGGMVVVGGILNLFFAVVYSLTYAPSTGLFAQPSPISVVPIFIITGLIFLAAGVMAYRGMKTKIMGIIAILAGLVQIVWLYLSGIIFVGGLLSFGSIFAIIGGIKAFSSKT